MTNLDKISHNLMDSNHRLKAKCGLMEKEIERLSEENDKLKQSYIQLKHRHSLLHDVCLDAECDRAGYHKDVLSLEKENEQLKEHLSTWRSSCCNYLNVYSILDNEVSILKETKDLDRFFEKFDKYSRMPFYEVEKSFIELQKENEQLKKDVDYWKQVASQYSNELNVFEHCKNYKTECKDIHWSSD